MQLLPAHPKFNRGLAINRCWTLPQGMCSNAALAQPILHPSFLQIFPLSNSLREDIAEAGHYRKMSTTDADYVQPSPRNIPILY